MVGRVATTTEPKPHRPRRLLRVFLGGLLLVESTILALGRGLEWTPAQGARAAVWGAMVWGVGLLLWVLLGRMTRRRFRFGLRTLMLVVAAWALALGWLRAPIERGWRQKRAVAALTARGAGCWYEESKTAWLKEVPGVDVFTPVIMVLSNPPGIDDEAMAYLADLPDLKELYVRGTGVTDEGLVHVQGLKQLEELGLEWTGVRGPGLVHLTGLPRLWHLILGPANVTDEALVYVKQLTQVRRLDLHAPRVTDAGLAHLKEMRQLEVLNVTTSGVTRAGLDELRRALPNTKILP